MKWFHNSYRQRNFLCLFWKGCDFLKNKITCVIVPVGQSAYKAEICPSLTELQTLVGGYIEIIPLGDRLVLIGDEDAKISGKEGNRHVGNDIIAGQFVVTASLDGDLVSLSSDEVEMLLQRFRTPETISQEEVEASCQIFFGTW